MSTGPEPVVVRFALTRGEVAGYYLFTQYVRRRAVWVLSIVLPGLIVVMTWLRRPEMPLERLAGLALLGLLIISACMWLSTAVVVFFRLCVAKRVPVLDACDATLDAKGVSITSTITTYTIAWSGIAAVRPGDSVVALEIDGGAGAAVLIPRRVVSDTQIAQLGAWWGQGHGGPAQL